MFINNMVLPLLQAQVVRESMLKSVRIEAGLGDPPSEYTNNAVESGNFILKYGLHFEPKKPHKFVTQVKDIINMQFRNEERAVFGKGPFKVRPDFSHLIPDEIRLGKMTHNQRTKMINRFIETGMDGRRDLLAEQGEDK